MAYDYYWTGYNFDMDLTALNELGYENVKMLFVMFRAKAHIYQCRYTYVIKETLHLKLN
jgi:hypothetical protein